MKTRAAFLIVLISLSLTLSGQNKWSIKTSAGIASAYSVVDGYYFSFDVGIPLLKYIQLSPTFSCISMVPNTYMYTAWTNMYENIDNGVPLNGPRQEREFGETYDAISLLLIFKPFALIRNEKFRKHELIIGAGLSYFSHIRVNTNYEITEDNYEITSFFLESDKGFAPYYGKIGYSYLINDKFSIGLMVGIDGVGAEGVLTAGLQLGAHF